MSIFWLIFAVIMFAIEAITPQLVAIWFAIGSVGGCITSLFTDNIWIQILVALLVTIVTLIVTRPLAKRVTVIKKTHTNSDRNIGKQALVISEIDNIKACGQIKVESSVWSAKSVDDTIIPKDSIVKVVAIKGAKLIVELEK